MIPTEIAALFQMQPETAIAYLKQKHIAESWDWQDMLDDAHVSAFTIAKSAELNVATDIYQAVLKAAKSGQTFSDFKRQLTPVLQQKGWWGKQTVLNPATGEERYAQRTGFRLPDGTFAAPSAGFNANQGKTFLQRTARVTIEKAQTAPPELAKVAVKEMMKQEKFRNVLTLAQLKWVAELLGLNQ